MLGLAPLGDLALADDVAATGGTTYNVTITETATASDASSTVLTAVGARSEAGAATETSTGLMQVGASTTETGTAAEAQTGLLIIAAADGEVATAADSQMGSLALASSVTEAGTAGEASSVALSMITAVAETGSASDAATGLLVAVASDTETATAAETSSSAVTGGTTYNDSTTETATAAEASSASLAAVGARVEAGAASDAATAGLTGVAAVSEAGSATEAQAASLAAVGNGIEAGAATDAATATGLLLASRAEAGAASEIALAAASVLSPAPVVYAGAWPVNNFTGAWPVNTITGAWPVNAFTGDWPMPAATGEWPGADFSSDWVNSVKTSRPSMLPAGDYSVNMTSNGISRQFILHVPPNMPANGGVVIVYHGGGGTNSAIQTGVGLDALADADGFATVYPQASGGNWTDGRASTVGGANDILFTQNIIAWLGAVLRVSPAKVFITGISNGGMFCHWLAYQSPGTIAGMATVAANIPDSYSSLITAQGPRMMFQGTADPLMLFAGGINAALGPESMTSTLNSIGKYRTANGAAAAVITSMPDLDPADGCTVTKRDYPGGAFQTTAYIVVNGGHQWPGGNGAGVGLSTNDISASALIVTMFHAYGL